MTYSSQYCKIILSPLQRISPTYWHVPLPCNFVIMPEWSVTVLCSEVLELLTISVWRVRNHQTHSGCTCNGTFKNAPPTFSTYAGVVKMGQKNRHSVWSSVCIPSSERNLLHVYLSENFTNKSFTSESRVTFKSLAPFLQEFQFSGPTGKEESELPKVLALCGLFWTSTVNIFLGTRDNSTVIKFYTSRICICLHVHVLNFILKYSRCCIQM